MTQFRYFLKPAGLELVTGSSTPGKSAGSFQFACLTRVQLYEIV